MFGTLHWNSKDKEAEFVERPHGSSNLERIPACDRCRAQKVKCRTNSNGCSRCKRLKKACTFRSTKQGGNNQRTRMGSIKLAHHECQLDFPLQSSASSTADDTGGPEQGRSNKRTSLPVDGKGDSGQEQGQELLLPELSTDFDASFLARLFQHISDQDGGALSPLPVFSTHESLLSLPVVSSGDEPPLHLSSTRQSLDPPVFEIGTTANSTLFLPQSPPGQSCQCLAAVVFAVEEFETSCNTGNRAELDSIIAYQKKAIKRCRSMINCTSCTSKRENLVLLVFIIDKIVTACGQIVVLYSMKDGGAPDTQAVSGLASCLLEDWDFDSSAHSSSCGSIRSASTGMLSDWRELVLGDYEVSSRQEWEHLVRVLILLQLRAVAELLADMQKMGGDVLGELQRTSLALAERRVCEFEKTVCIL